MRNLSNLTITLAITITGLPAIANSTPRDRASPPADSSSLICYIQTPDGRTLNLAKLCEPPIDPSSQKPSNSNPNENANLGGLEQTAKNGCFVLDASGRPCASQ
jgi:hypothetical protein